MSNMSTTHSSDAIMLCQLGATSHVVNRLLTISEQDNSPTRDCGNLAATVAWHEITDSRNFLRTIEPSILNSENRFLYDTAATALQMSENRLNSSRSVQPFQIVPEVSPELGAFIAIVADATRIEYHAQQLRATPNPTALRLHSNTIDELVSMLNRYAALFLDSDEPPTELPEPHLPLFHAAHSSMNTAITSFRTIIATRRERADVTKTTTIANLPGQTQIDQLIQTFRNSVQPVMVTVARLQPSVIGRSQPLVPIIVYDYDLTITCKMLAEAYAPGTPTELVEQHIIAAQQYAIHLSNQGAANAEALFIQQSCEVLQQAMQTFLHDVSIAQLQSFCDTLFQNGVSPTSIRDLINSITQRHRELTSYLFGYLQIPPSATAEQAQDVLNAAGKTGLHPTTVRAIANLLDADPTELQLPANDYGNQHLETIISAADTSLIPYHNMLQTLVELGFNPNNIAGMIPQLAHFTMPPPAEPAPHLLLPGAV